MARDRSATARERARPVFLSTPFDEQRAELLAALGVCAFPVAAARPVHVPLLRALGGFGRPILLATALAAKGEIDAALAAIGEAPVRRPAAAGRACWPARREPDGTSDLRAIGRARDAPCDPAPAGAIAGPVTCSRSARSRAARQSS